MLCERCGKAIRPGEEYDTVDKFSPSGGGISGVIHRERCKRPYTQTAPVSRAQRIRGA